MPDGGYKTTKIICTKLPHIFLKIKKCRKNLSHVSSSYYCICIIISQPHPSLLLTRKTLVLKGDVSRVLLRAESRPLLQMTSQILDRLSRLQFHQLCSWKNAMLEKEFLTFC